MRPEKLQSEFDLNGTLIECVECLRDKWQAGRSGFGGLTVQCQIECNARSRRAPEKPCCHHPEDMDNGPSIRIDSQTKDKLE